MENINTQEKEQERLNTTLDEIDEQVNQIGPKYYGDDFTEQVLDSLKDERRTKLLSLSTSPYFGRIDFRESEESLTKSYYIGKHGLDNKDSAEPWVIDWRAPVASIFYSFTGGEESVSYEAPDETIEGQVYLKRNLVVRERILQRLVDSYVHGEDNLSVKDDFLLYKLGEQKDHRLRDIVSTIQAEQDRIIRAPKNTSLVIQGVAGSGKTTVALHRLAYLLYQYKEKIKVERMVIFAPNTMFLDYISDVLPELGVGGIQQTTFVIWALDQLKEDVKLSSEAKEILHWFSVKRAHRSISNRVPGRIKGSIHFKEYLDLCMQAYEANAVPNKELVLWKECILTPEQVKIWYYQDYRHEPLAKRKDRVTARIKRWMEIELKELPESYRKDRRKKAKQKMNTYMKKWMDITPMSFYKECFEEPSKTIFMTDAIQKELPDKFVLWMRKCLNKQRVDVDDLTPLLYIHIKLYGLKGKVFDHVVIDEAQDVSPFQIELLKQYMRDPSFTILGDLGQGIHEYKGVRDWEEVKQLFESKQIAYFELVQSYRSTTEIVEFANHILAHAGLTTSLAQPVFRNGEPVEVVHLGNESHLSDFMVHYIQKQQKRASSIAIIGRTDEECAQLYKILIHHQITCTLINADQSKYLGGVSVLPVYLSKGLEFDAVLLMSIDGERYPLNPLHAKLLYVGCTRALHHLTVAYQKEASPLLPEGK